MFRSIRPARTIFGMSRLPLSMQLRTQQGRAQNIQVVKFVRPPMKKRAIQFAITLTAIYVGLSVYERVVLGPLDKAVAETAASLPDDEEEEEAGFFIPFPGTTKQLKPNPYKGSDPEWQEFIRFSKDQQMAKRVRDELASFVKGLADKHPVLTVRCGKGMKLRRYWLDVDFPTHPPPEFERSGIGITDDSSIGWTTMPVDSLTVFRLRSVLWPSALAQSLWSFTRVLIVDDAQRLASKFGVQIGTPPPTIEQLIARQQQIMKGNTVPTKDGPPKPKQPQPLGDVQKQITGITPSPSPSGPEKSNGAGGKPSDGIDMSNSGTRQALAFQMHFLRAIQAFKLKFQQTYRPAPDYPPRGSILVSGMVEIDAPKAWLVFDVKAAWDPKEKAYDARSMNLKLRRMQMKKQGPIGGH